MLMTTLTPYRQSRWKNDAAHVRKVILRCTNSSVCFHVTCIEGGVVLQMSHSLDHSVHAAASPPEDDVPCSDRRGHPGGGQFCPLLRDMTRPAMDHHHWQHVNHLSRKCEQTDADTSFKVAISDMKDGSVTPCLCLLLCHDS